ncbi:peptidylprolyl isomerase [soil metagenome]
MTDFSRRSLLALLCLAGAPFVACNEAVKDQTKDFDAEAGEKGASVKKNVKPEPDAEVAVIETELGRLVVELYPNLAPQHVERFKKLAAEGFYNGTTLHRIDPNLGIIQGGDPNSKDSNPFNDGTGKSPYPDLPAEFSDVSFERGIVAAARSGSFDSANSQFFIMLKPQPAFEQPGNRYTIFGRVTEGINNAAIISTAPVREGTTDRPADPVAIKSVTLQPRSNFK